MLAQAVLAGLDELASEERLGVAQEAVEPLAGEGHEGGKEDLQRVDRPQAV